MYAVLPIAHSNFNDFHSLVASSRFCILVWLKIFAIEFYKYYSVHFFRRISILYAFSITYDKPHHYQHRLDFYTLIWVWISNENHIHVRAKSEAMKIPNGRWSSLASFHMFEFACDKVHSDACFLIIQLCTKFSFSGSNFQMLNFNEHQYWMRIGCKKLFSRKKQKYKRKTLPQRMFVASKFQISMFNVYVQCSN